MKKVLIAYYSHSGTTKRIAQLLQEKTGGDLYEIRSKRIYNSDMWKADEEARIERESDNLPALAAELPDLGSYDAVLLGGPVWHGGPANPIRSFLQEMDFQDKKVAAFWTFMDYEGTYAKTIQSSVQHAIVETGLSLSMASLRSASLERTIGDWLNSLER